MDQHVETKKLIEATKSILNTKFQICCHHEKAASEKSYDLVLLLFLSIYL
jgi:hypothetical protein